MSFYKKLGYIAPSRREEMWVEENKYTLCFDSPVGTKYGLGNTPISIHISSLRDCAIRYRYTSYFYPHFFPTGRCNAINVFSRISFDAITLKRFFL